VPPNFLNEVKQGFPRDLYKTKNTAIRGEEVLLFHKYIGIWKQIKEIFQIDK